MPQMKRPNREKLPRRFEDLVALQPPRAIMDESDYDNTLEMIDRLMAEPRHSQGQSVYLETLVQLVQAYEAEHHAIDTSGLTGLEMLRHVMEESGMTASGLARLLGVHASMGSKILKGERSLTVEHVKKLAVQFRVSPALFMT